MVGDRLVTTSARTTGAIHGAKPAPTRQDLLALARRRFLKGQRLDMQAMGVELGVSRTTVYRWAGNHDQLLGEVLSGLSYDTFQVAQRGVRGGGRARIMAVYANFMHLLATSEPLRIAVRRDPHQFLRVVTRSGPVHRTTISLCEELIRREMERGAIRITGDVGAIASAMVYIGEGALYADMLAGVDPDVERSAEVLALLLSTP
jgi:AcrR family transcriptional regulator